LYLADQKRYDTMLYRRCGRSGIRLPAISLGLWHNFGGVDDFESSRAMVRRAFDLALPTSTWPTTMDLRRAAPKATSARFCASISSPIATN
jgi:hypothetical protein